MSPAELLQMSLEQTVEALGDPAPAVFALMYERYPALLQYRDGNSGWEEYMMQEIIGNLMQYAEDPATAKVTLRDMSAHHALIGVPNDVFRGMYHALTEVFTPTFHGVQREAMLAAWEESVRGIQACVVGANG